MSDIDLAAEFPATATTLAAERITDTVPQSITNQTVSAAAE